MPLIQATRLRTGLLPNYLGAVALGFLGAAAGGAAWYLVTWASNLHMSVVAMAIGAGGGYGVFLGSRRMRGPGFQAMSVIIVLIVLVATEALIERLLWARRWAEQGIDGVAFLAPLDAYWNLVSTGIATDPPTILFFTIALGHAIVIPRRSTNPYESFPEATARTPWG